LTQYKLAVVVDHSTVHRWAIKVVLLTEQELAEHWRMSIRTLQGWRYRKTGPKFVKIRGQAVRYPKDDVLVYEAQWR
jgi:transposase-like protein